MTDRQKIELALSTCRSRIRELAGKDDATDEERTEMRSEQRNLETLEERFRALTMADEPEAETRETPAPVADAPVDTEKRERDGLLDRASVCRFVQRATQQRSLDGVEAELAAITPEGGMPMELLFPETAESKIEKRAVAAAPATSYAEQPQTWIGRAFRGSLLDALRVSTQSVNEGRPQWIEITSGAAPAMFAKGATVGDAAFTYRRVNVDMHRHAASLLMAREDLAMFGQMEARLRADLSAAMTESITDRVINESAEFDGFLDELTFTDVASAVPTFDDIQDLAYDSNAKNNRDSESVQGTRWIGESSLEKVMGKLYHATRTNDNQTALDWLRANSAGVQFTSFLPDAVSNKVKLLGVRQGGPIASVLGVWNSVQFIVDDVSGALVGQRRVTAESMIGFQVIRPAVYIGRDYQTA